MAPVFYLLFCLWLYVRDKCYETGSVRLWGEHPISPPGFLDYFDAMKVQKTELTLRVSTAPIYGVCTRRGTGGT
jgi:hypothetical protein